MNFDNYIKYTNLVVFYIDYTSDSHRTLDEVKQIVLTRLNQSVIDLDFENIKAYVTDHNNGNKYVAYSDAMVAKYSVLEKNWQLDLDMESIKKMLSLDLVTREEINSIYERLDILSIESRTILENTQNILTSVEGIQDLIKSEIQKTISEIDINETILKTIENKIDQSTQTLINSIQNPPQNSPINNIDLNIKALTNISLADMEQKDGYTYYYDPYTKEEIARFKMFDRHGINTHINAIKRVYQEDKDA